MNKKILVILSAALVVAGFILAPALCGPVTSDEHTMDYYVDASTPVIVTLIVFVLAAVCVCALIRTIAQEKGNAVNPFLVGMGIGIFGLFYALKTVYRDAANTLNEFYNTWGAVDKISGIIPEVAGKFNMTAKNYGSLMWLGVVIIFLGIYRIKKASEKSKSQ